jgi:hypothetical protein
MPTDTVLFALLQVDTGWGNNSSIWCWPEWQKFTNLESAPYLPDYNEVVPQTMKLEKATCHAVTAFYKNFKTMSRLKNAGKSEDKSKAYVTSP